jgi:hypothetical protein
MAFSIRAARPPAASAAGHRRGAAAAKSILAGWVTCCLAQPDGEN